MNLFSKKKCTSLPFSTFFMVVLFAASLIFSGCSNSDFSAVSSSVGAAVKGPFKSGSTVEVYEINADGTLKAGPSWTGSVSDDQGNFSMDLGSFSGAVEVQVTGSYLNELTGVYENASVPLKAVFYKGAEEGLTGNVNTATSLAAEKAKQLMAEGKGAKEAVDQASSDAASLFSFITEAEFTALGAEEPKDYLKKLDITDITNAANAKFLLFNAAIMKLSKDIQDAGFTDFDPLELIELMAKNLSPSGSQDWQVTESQMKELLDKDVLIPAETALLDGLTGKLNAYIAGIVAGIGQTGDAAKIITNLESIFGFTGTETDLNQSFSMSEIKKTTSQGLLKYEGSDIKVSLENKPLTSEGINVSEKDGIVTAELISPDYTYGSSTGTKGDDMYLFVQKVDKNKVKIVAEELVCEECTEQLSGSGLTKTVFSFAESTEKPTPKTISSSDASTSVVITNMKLKKDITMAVTPYKSPLYVPKLNQIGEDIGDTSVKVISGGDINIVDSNGIPVTAAEACFCATVRFISARIIGEMTGQEIFNKVTAGEGTLHLLVFKEKKWQMVDQPQVTITDQGGGVYAVNQNLGKTLRLYPFVFVFKPKAELVFTGSISGTVTDKDGNPLKGVLVGLKGNDTFDVTSSADADKGSFEIPYKSFISEEPVTHILSFKKSDYLDAIQAAQVTSTLPYATGIDVQLEKIQNFFDLSGQVKKMVDGVAEGIGGALVTLYTPVVLDNISINGTTITTGLDSTATYTWEIKDNGTSIYTDSGTGAEGKNIFALDSFAQAVMTVDGVYSLKVTVVHTKSGNTYTESQTGIILKAGTTYTAIMDPTSLYPSELTVKADGSGYYLFGNLDQNMDGLLSLKGEAIGYQPSALISPPAGNISENQLSENIILESQSQPGETAGTGLYSEGFETEAIDQNWTFVNTSNLVGWQVLSNPETVMVSEGIVEGAMQQYEEEEYFQSGVLFPDRKTIDVVGTITAITDSTAIVSFTKNGETEPTTVSVTLTDTNGDQSFDSVTNNYSSYETAQYDVWLQSYTQELIVDSQVTVSYPDPFDTEISLLPAFGGDTVLWYGYTGTGTFSDQDSNTSTEVNSGEAISPVIDLTNFSYATGNFKTWYEVESVDVASGQFDQMRIFVAVVDDQTEDIDVPIYDGNTLYQFTKGTYYELAKLNPLEEPPGMQQPFLNYSSGGVNAIPIWVNRELNLNPFAGHKIRMKFSFATNDTSYNGFRGWAIDDASITNEKSDLDFSVDMSSQPEQQTLQSKSLRSVVPGKSFEQEQ
jgi:hypothetical protein